MRPSDEAIYEGTTADQTPDGDVVFGDLMTILGGLIMLPIYVGKMIYFGIMALVKR